MQHLKLLTTVLVVSIVLVTGCKKDFNGHSRVADELKKSTLNTSPQVSAELKAKLNSLQASLPAGYENRERVVLVYQLYGFDPAISEYAADLLIQVLNEIPQYRKGDHPIFTFNAFASPDDFIPPVGAIPKKITMGDGILEAFTALGFDDVAPPAILARAFTNNQHPGTPTQRMAAAEWGYSVANAAQKQGLILTAQQFDALFEAQLPDIIAH
jgi:hypothetical protein